MIPNYILTNVRRDVTKATTREVQPRHAMPTALAIFVAGENAGTRGG